MASSASVLCALLLLFLTAAAASAAAPPTGLQLALMDKPAGVDTLGPHHFTWRHSRAAAPGSRLAPADVQAACQLRVQAAPRAGEPARTIWDSGLRPRCDRPELVVPALPLASDRSYVWSVRTQARGAAAPTEWAAAVGFSTGLLSQDEWHGRWIRGGTQMRRTFEVSGPVERATIFVSACQYYRLTLDGVRIGNSELDVGWTSFKTNRSYTTYDIEPALLAPGKHTLGLRVGQGFCTASSPLTDPHVGDEYDANAQRSALLQLQMHAPGGGEPTIVASDGSWMVSDGPILMDSTYCESAIPARLSQRA